MRGGAHGRVRREGMEAFDPTHAQNMGAREALQRFPERRHMEGPSGGVGLGVLCRAGLLL